MFDLNSYGRIVSFEVYPVSVLGDDHRKLKILSVVDFETAKLFVDAASLAVMVYPTLPSSTDKDYRKYKYLKLQRADKKIICIALEWINLDTVTFHTDVVVTVRLKLEDVTTIDTVRKLLLANNFEPLEITTE